PPSWSCAWTPSHSPSGCGTTAQGGIGATGWTMAGFLLPAPLWTVVRPRVGQLPRRSRRPGARRVAQSAGTAHQPPPRNRRTLALTWIVGADRRSTAPWRGERTGRGEPPDRGTVRAGRCPSLAEAHRGRVRHSAAQDPH